MATLERRVLKSGSTTWRVKWRVHSSRAFESLTFADERTARRYRKLIEADDHAQPAQHYLGPVADDEDGPTVAEWLVRYVDSLSGIEERTRADYRGYVERSISPHLGDTPLTELTREDVSRWVLTLQRTKAASKTGKLAPKTIRNRHGLLSTALEEAVRARILTHNVAKGVRLPRVDSEDRDPVYLTEPEFELLCSCATEDVQPLLRILVGTGLRYGEASALQVRDVDLLAKGGPVLHVRRAWKREGGKFHLGPPKTKKSRRTLQLSPGQVDVLAPLLVRPGEEFVFVTAQGAWWRHSTFYGRRWLPAVKEARGLGLTKTPKPHDLRHTHASWLISAGVSLPVVQARLGHESIQTTVDVYGDLMPSAHGDALAVIDRALARH